MVESEGPFISTETLADLMRNLGDKLCIVNASIKPESEVDVYREHARGRIPGAKFLDLTLVKDLQSPYPFMMPNKRHFVHMMKALGIRKSQIVVIYETGKGWFAARAAFMLKAFGHPQVYLLDGNFAKWQKEGRETQSDDIDETFEEDFKYDLNPDLILSYERVKDVSNDQTIQIIDNRPQPAFESGNIPNSKNVAGPHMLNQDGTTKTAAEIKTLF